MQSNRRKTAKDPAPAIATKPATSRDRVILEVRNLFLAGELKPNQRLTEADLSERLGVSRTPVREAFRELAHLGLLVAEPFKGVRVADLDLAALRGVYEVRAELEGLAAALAAERMTGEELDQLERVNDGMERAYPNQGQSSTANEQFHLLLSKAAHNDYLADLIASARVRIGAFRAVFHYHPDLILESVRGHKEVIDALRQRDPERSRAAMHRHIVLGLTQTTLDA